MQRIKILSLSIVFFIIFSQVCITAQTAGQHSGQLAYAKGYSLGSSQISEIENINYFTGRVNISIPLASISGRGNVGYPINANISSPGWSTYVEQVPDNSGTTQPQLFSQFGNVGAISGSGGFEITSKMSIGYSDTTRCYGTPYYQRSVTKMYVRMPDGTEYELRDTLTDGQPMSMTACNVYRNRGRTFISKDGSNIKFVSDIDVYDNEYDPNYGSNGIIYFPDGTTYKFANGSQVQDRNGNISTFTSLMENGIPVTKSTDSLKRTVTVNPYYYSITATTANPATGFVKYKGVSGQDREVSIIGATMSNALVAGQTIKTHGQLFPYLSGQGTFNPFVISAIVMPNGQSYHFKYNSYGELARIEFPTGGAVEYTWVNGVDGTDSSGHVNPGAIVNSYIYRRVSERRLYIDGINLTSTMTISRPEYISGYNIGNTGYVDIKNFSPQLVSFERHYYNGQATTTFNEPDNGYSYSAWKTGREYQTDVYSPQNSNLLRRTTQLWQQNSPSWWTCQVCNADNAPVNNPKVIETTTLLADSNQISRKTFSYDSFNNLTDTYEYDYGVGVATSGSFIRRSHTDYLTVNPVNNIDYTSGNIHILGLANQTWVSSDIAGLNKVSLTKFEYDNYTDDQNHASLLDRSNISGHDLNYDTNFITRGNVTKITNFSDAANQGGAVSSYVQYDISGNPVKTIDARGYANTIDFSDRFGSPDSEARSNSFPSSLNGQQTFAFASSTTNSLGTAYVQVDYFSGNVVDTEDINENVNTTYYNDALDRPTQNITANNRTNFRNQDTIIYDESNHRIIVTSDSKSFNDNLLKVESYYDKMGRTTETRQYETSSNYIVTLQQYDSLGRAYKSSNPFRPYLNEQPQWTTTSFDDLGRVVQVTTPDNAVVTRSYLGTTTTVTDQYLRKRSGTSDAIGRLLKVVEDPNGLNYETSYIYDVLGRLRKTTQTEGQTTQNRYFMYDDLGRLIRAKQPEQLANSDLSISDPITGNSNWSVKYVYDNNNNVTSTTDAKNRTVTGNYDVLNRLTFRDYSDSTPDVTFIFDDQNVPNSKGQLTAVVSSISQTNFTSFDEFGRIKSSSQTTGGQTYNFPDYSYDLSGELISQTYPSLRVVKTETDTLGRLSRVASQLPNQFERTHLSNLSYTSFGAVSQAKLGNGRWESTQFDNKRLQIKQIGLGASAGDTSLLKLEYGYGTTDNNGSLREQKITVSGMSSQIIQNYTYDMLNRLQSATETPTGTQTASWKQTFSYDRFGNRRFNTNASNTTTLPADNAVYNPQINQTNNQFTVAEGYNYDSEGNLTSNPENQLFTYDAENHQTQVQNTFAQTTANYYYDGIGKRIKKVIGNQETVFVYDAFGKLVAEYTTNQTITTNGTQYLTTDALGSPRVTTNVAGQVASRHDYMPFGEEVNAGISGRTATQGYGANDKVRQQFTGYERDGESGLDYAQARYFASKHGRFTSVDPLTASASIKNPQTLNRYTYGLNSPYKFTDSTGLYGSDISCGGNTSGGGQGSTLMSCEMERSLDAHNQRLQNTYDVIAANKAIAAGDQKAAEAKCASNANIECIRAPNISISFNMGQSSISDHDELWNLLFGKTSNSFRINMLILNIFGKNATATASDGSSITILNPVKNIIKTIMDAARHIYTDVLFIEIEGANPNQDGLVSPKSYSSLNSEIDTFATSISKDFGNSSHTYVGRIGRNNSRNFHFSESSIKTSVKYILELVIQEAKRDSVFRNSGEQ